MANGNGGYKISVPLKLVLWLLVGAISFGGGWMALKAQATEIARVNTEQDKRISENKVISVENKGSYIKLQSDMTHVRENVGEVKETIKEMNRDIQQILIKVSSN